MDIVDVTRP